MALCGVCRRSARLEPFGAPSMSVISAPSVDSGSRDVDEHVECPDRQPGDGTGARLSLAAMLPRMGVGTPDRRER
jgi:hypothetical protein